MSGNKVRLQAITDVEAYVPPKVSFDTNEAPGEIFGENVFSKVVMQKRLPKSVYKSVIATIEHGETLDPLVADGILKLLMRLQKETQVSYLFITHDIATVRAIADSVAVMHRGKLVRFGPKSKVLQPPFDDYTDLLLKSVPEMRVGWLEEVRDQRRMAAAGN